uniref:Extensin-like n=1 Tax=Diabrotica virgifera virgifera TaxID=50390 RepID=A0A6P7GKA7_DIAVI
MHPHCMLLVLTITALGLAIEQRKPKLVRNTDTNHLRIADPDPNDSEYMKFEATGSNKNNKKVTNKTGDEDKPKTLSQQIADGKYALIQKEIFSKPPKRPGILSYDHNPEVPNDNINNLGGLDKDEIWLAENHLLVLRGGNFPPYDEKRDHPESPWAPLDNYKAPLHQVKIPKNPKIPPPFPVQLTENGPLQILGTNSSRTFNGTYEEALNSISPPEGYPPPAPFFQPYNPDSANFTPWSAPMPIPGNAPPGELPGGLPLPPVNLNGTLPPSLSYLPPGAVILPPPGNQTDYIDYDDPSIYYPPPYSFYYPKDNSSAVPAGPLVPGIILPPPPNFFAQLEDTTGVSPTRKPQRYRKPTTTQVTITITKSTTLTPTTTKKTNVPPKTVKIYPVKNQQYIKEIRTSTTPRPTIKSVTIVPEVFTVPQRPKYQPTQRRKPGVTILRPIKPAETPPKVYSYENEISNQPLIKEYGPPARVTTTAVPLKYQSTSNNIDTNSVTEETGKLNNFRKGKAPKTTLRPAQYYFYEEQEREPEVPVKTNTYVENNEPYYVRPRPIAPQRQRKPQYVYVTAKPYNTQKPRFRFIQQPVSQDTFNIHINKLKDQIQQYYTTPRTTFRNAPKPVYQFSFQAANYPSQQTNFKPSPQVDEQDQFQPIPPKYTVEIQQAIQIIPSEAPKYQENQRPVFYQQTTERPYYTTAAPPEYPQEVVTPRPNYVQNVATPRPISEYSFEATPNPVYQGYYTKPDENYFDDRTKTYFTVFGRKLPAATTPIPQIEPSPLQQGNYQQGSYQQRPISLEGDTLVNYVHPRPNINPDAEIIPANNPPNYPNVVRYSPRPIPKQNSEIIKAIPYEVPSSESQDGSFISYQLPGDDGAHFYFLTPQLAQRKDQGSGFYYSKARRRRNEKTADVER